VPSNGRGPMISVACCQGKVNFPSCEYEFSSLVMTQNILIKLLQDSDPGIYWKGEVSPLWSYHIIPVEQSTENMKKRRERKRNHWILHMILLGRQKEMVSDFFDCGHHMALVHVKNFPAALGKLV
jgi:hypothetical protein